MANDVLVDFVELLVVYLQQDTWTSPKCVQGVQCVHQPNAETD